MRLIARRLVARRLVASIDGSRWCREQEGAHRPPAGRLLHSGLHLSAFCDLSVKNSPRENVRPDECAEMFVPIEFASRRCDTNSPRSSLKISEREFVDRLPKTGHSGQDTQDRTPRTGHPGQDTREQVTRSSRCSKIMSGSTNLNPTKGK